LTPEEYIALRDRLHQAGYTKEILWCETVGPPKFPLQFFMEYAWVVLNSGMKNQVAENIWHRVLDALMFKGWQVDAVFRHSGKSKAIQNAWDNQESLFQEFSTKPADELLDWLQALPWIGPITKYHLAKNLGMDVCKPDRHLMRIAAKYELTPEELCASLARETGNRIGTVDYVLWRAANLGIINFRGQIVNDSPGMATAPRVSGHKAEGKNC